MVFNDYWLVELNSILFLYFISLVLYFSILFLSQNMLFDIISFPLFLEFPLLSLLNHKDNMPLIFMPLFIISN